MTKNFTVENISGSIVNDFTFVEKTNTDSVIIQGLLLPKDKISRNNVLYDWDSIKSIHKKLVGKPVMYNHLVDTADKPVGHYIDSWVKEKDDADGLAGWYYKANLDKSNDYTQSVLRGDLRNVSIQVTASASKQENSDDGKTYTRAYIGTIMEASLVPCAGYEETTIEVALAEAFKRKEAGQTTTNNPLPAVMADDEEKEESSCDDDINKERFYNEFIIGFHQEYALLEEKSFESVVTAAEQAVNKLKQDKNAYGYIERCLKQITE